MNRKDKIKMLQDITAGKVQIEDIMPTRGRIWVQDRTDPFLFNCTDENLTRRLEEIPLIEIEKGFKVNNVKMVADSTSRMVYERMKENEMLKGQEKNP